MTTIKELNDEIERFTTENERLRAQLSEVAGEIKDLSSVDWHRKCNDDIERLAAENAKLEKQLRLLKVHAANLEDSLSGSALAPVTGLASDRREIERLNAELKDEFMRGYQVGHKEGFNQ